jgi:biopolymer transport protein ExbD
MRWLSIALLACTALAGDDVELQRVGSVGMVPPEGARTDITVRADGSIHVRGKEVDFATLRFMLRGASSSVANIHLRADRRLPWQAMQWILMACAENRLSRVFHSVLPEKGDKPGALALFLPEDGPRPGAGAELQVGIGAKGRGDPAALYAELKAGLANTDRATLAATRVTLRAEPACELGWVLQTCDAILRAGIRQIEFGAPGAPVGRDLKELVADLAGARPAGFPALTLEGKTLVEPAQQPMPERKRLDGAFVGSMELRTTAAEEEEVTEAPEKSAPSREQLLDDLRGEATVRARIRSAHRRALTWLASTQKRDGSWGDPKATAAAMMALSWSGHTPTRGLYRSTALRGTARLVQNANAGIADARTAGLHLLALSDLNLKGGDDKLRAAGAKAAAAVVKARGDNGDWADKQTTVVCLAAIRAALVAGITVEGVDAGKINNAFFEKVKDTDFGEKADTPLEWVLGTLAKHHQGGRAWSEWQAFVTPLLEQHQKKDGSWGEDAYTTAMIAMCAQRILN